VAGGVGLAPLRPVLLSALARRGDYRRVTLIAGARAPAEFLFRGQLRDWACAYRPSAKAAAASSSAAVTTPWPPPPSGPSYAQLRRRPAATARVCRSAPGLHRACGPSC